MRLVSTLTEKIREALVSVLPVMAIVLLLHLTIAPMQEGQLPQFVVGGALLTLGLAVFLVGADIGMVPFGQKVGSALTRRRSLRLMLPSAFAIGFAITIAEPDVQVLATQVHGVNPAIRKTPLLLMIAAGVGIFLLIGITRIVFRLSLRWLLTGFYLLVFLACLMVEPIFVGVAFDSGGATTGPITVPFIMAIGIGVASAMRKEQDDDSSFGLVGLASIGPIAAVAFMGMIASGTIGGTEFSPTIVDAAAPLALFARIFPHIVQEIGMALLPLLAFFFLFQVTLLRLPARQMRRLVIGLVYVFVGLVLFMTGVNGGFSLAGQSLGMALGALGNGIPLIPVGLVLGAVVVCAEPAVWILTEQVENVSGGYIRRPIMLIALSISIALAVALGMIRVITGISIWWMLVPGYFLSLALTWFCPRLFTAIAFDSGGVASGPMSATFILSLTLGASAAVGGNPATDAFGMIAMIAMAPLITIQILGVAVKIAEKKRKENP